MVPVNEDDDNTAEKPGDPGLVTLSLQGIAGAVWLANPVDPTQLGATSTAGLALKVRYGFNTRWSFETELAGARSGSTSWDGMMYENQEGEISRDATLGRVLLGGLLHFGDKYRPIFRLGVGFQGVSHGSRFVPATGAERDGPGDGFAVDGLWTVGLGFEARLGRNWTFGLGANFVSVASDKSGLSSSVEGGLNLSYGWIPGN